MEKIIELLNKVFEEAHLSCEVCYGGKFLGVIDTIEVSIRWGDWKHEHLRMKWLAENALSETGFKIFKWDDKTTEENGSDCYSALHTAYLVDG